MSNAYWSIKHVESMSDLPENLVRGWAYFVDDEQVIVIDHGRGPMVYGGKAGPQGIAGDPIPQLQDQTDDLAAASFSLQALIYELHQKHKVDSQAQTERIDSETARLESALESETQELTEKIKVLEENHARDFRELTEHYSLEIANVNQTAAENLHAIQANLADRFDFLTELSSQNAEAVLLVNLMLREQFQKYDSMFTTLTKCIMNLYPADYDSTVIETLSSGDSVSYDGATWTVSNYTTDDSGMISFTLTQ